MATNSIFGVQPFEELVSLFPLSCHASLPVDGLTLGSLFQAQEEEPTSPTSLEEFYREQEKKDLERRRSKVRRRRRGSSRASEPETPANEQPTQLPPVHQGQPQKQQQLQLQQDQPPPSSQQEQPPPQLTWQQNRQSGLWWTHESTFKTRYEIHNPTPNPYPWVNHHLLPPGTTFPPPTTAKPPRKSPPTSYNFTPSLPDGFPRVRDASGTQSTSNSSNSTFLRSRSVTHLGTTTLHHDNVDFLDASDPWGMRWHHDGRYDVPGASRAPPLPAWSNGTTSLPSDVSSYTNHRSLCSILLTFHSLTDSNLAQESAEAGPRRPRCSSRLQPCSYPHPLSSPTTRPPSRASSQNDTARMPSRPPRPPRAPLRPPSHPQATDTCFRVQYLDRPRPSQRRSEEASSASSV